MDEEYIKREHTCNMAKHASRRKPIENGEVHRA